MFLFGPDGSNSGTGISIGVGITVGLLAAFIQSLGLTIQRKSHVLNQEAPESERKVEHRRPLWLFGFAIFISSNILGSIFQIASLPVVILAPLGAVSLLWNALFARLILGDDFSKFMVLGTLLIVAGAVLIARFGIVPEPTHSLDDLLALFRRDAFVVYFSLLGAAVVIALVVTHIAEWSLYRRIRAQARILLPNDDDDSSSSSCRASPIPMTPTERTPLLVDRKRAATPSSVMTSGSSTVGTSSLHAYRSTLNLLAVSYASASGIISGMCLIFAKSGVELLVLTIGGQNQFYRWESWALVGALGICALLQLWYLHKSLVLADPTLVCPLSFCFYNVSTIFNGLIYYDQLQLLTSLQLGLVILGIAVLLTGVYAASIQSDDDDRPEGREGDWVPADEEGVAPAVAPADVVRVVERMTGTLPTGDLPSTVLGEDRPQSKSQTSPPVSPSSKKSYAGRKAASVDFGIGLGHPPRASSSPPPSASPIQEYFPDQDGVPPARPRAPGKHRGHPHHAHTQVSPLRASAIPQFTSLLSPEEPTPVIPGLQIGISAVSPGWPTALRKKKPQQQHGVGPLNRRSVSDGFGADIWRRSSLVDESGGLVARGRRRANSVDSQEQQRPERDETAEDGQRGPRGLGWVWRVAAWRPGRRKSDKSSSPDAGAVE